MSRIARKNYYTSFFHVMVQGVNKEYIFNKEEYMKQYKYLMLKYEKEYNVNVIAYCIMNNHSHMLVYTEKINNMSNYMHQINTLYAQYYNYKQGKRVGCVFRGRFKSQPIYDKLYFVKCINYIHMNPVKALMVKKCEDYKYSSYNYYKDNINNMRDKKISFVRNYIECDDYMKVLEENMNNNDLFCDISEDINKIIDNKILIILQKEKKKIQDIFQDKELIIKVIKELRKDDYKIENEIIMKKLNISKNKYFLLKK